MLQSNAAIQSRLDSLQQQVDSQARDRASRVTLFFVGLLIGLLIAVLIVGVLWAINR